MKKLYYLIAALLIILFNNCEAAVPAGTMLPANHPQLTSLQGQPVVADGYVICDKPIETGCIIRTGFGEPNLRLTFSGYLKIKYPNADVVNIQYVPSAYNTNPSTIIYFKFKQEK